jgi:hypothetical protein
MAIAKAKINLTMFDSGKKTSTGYHSSCAVHRGPISSVSWWGRGGTMRTVILATLTAAGLGLLTAPGAYAIPANGPALGQAAAAAQSAEQAWWRYRYRYRYRYWRRW